MLYSSCYHNHTAVSTVLQGLGTVFWLESSLAASSWLDAAFLRQAPCFYLEGGLCAEGWTGQTVEGRAVTSVLAHSGPHLTHSLTGLLLCFRCVETRLLSNVISLLHTLWVTNLGNKAPEQGGQPPCQPGSRESQRMLALHIVDEFLYVLISLTTHLR